MKEGTTSLPKPKRSRLDYAFMDKMSLLLESLKKYTMMDSKMK
jgi:hypothetical protein